MKYFNLYLNAILLILITGCNAYDNKRSNLSADSTAHLISEAYYHCFPIVENYKAMYAYAVDTTSPKFLPMNTMYNSAVLYSPADKFVVSPNNDTYYTTVTLDMRAEPVIISVPEIKNRYYSFQLTSMVTDNFGYIGTNTTGTKAATYAITSPNFKGQLPPGVIEIKSPSEIVGVIGRTAVNVEDSVDVKEAKKVQSMYKIGVMHKFYPDLKPEKVLPIQFPSYQESDKENERYFSILNFLLQYINLSEDDKRIISGYKQIGIVPGEPYTFFDDNPQLQAAIRAGISKGIAKIDSTSRKLGKVVNGWTMYPLGEYFGTNYVDRTNVAKMGIYANSPFEAFYPLAFVDENNEILTGSNTYAITFKAGELPPVKYFWSLTMYDNRTQLLVENSIKRYSIGDRTKGLRFNKDSSLTIYVGASFPSAGKSNWLPAPDSGFNVMMRLYGPEPQVLNANWTPPPIKKVKG